MSIGARGAPYLFTAAIVTDRCVGGFDQKTFDLNEINRALKRIR